MSLAAPAAPVRELLASFARNRMAFSALMVLGVIVLAVLFASYISPQNPYNLAELDILDGKLAPGGKSVNGHT
ncbi:MAG: ABC transporter permease, partial [Pseudomonadota bacterium]